MPSSIWQSLQLDRHADVPLTRQLASTLRTLVSSGHLSAGEKLPPSRELAIRLGLSRGTVTEVFETLAAEGYLEARVGAGTYVQMLPEKGQNVGQPSQRAKALAALAPPTQQLAEPPKPFQHSQPDRRLFAWQVWAKLEGQVSQTGMTNKLTAAGLPELREQVALYLRRERGLNCVAGQVIITTGTQQAIDIVARTLLDVGDQAGAESPGYLGMQAALMAAGLDVVPLAIDRDGLDPAALWRRPKLALACITPAHQFPTGAVLAPERRLELVRWAETRGGWILEDDYDSEYHYSGPQLTPLATLSQRVIHTGTFSATLFSGLRLGFLVTPLHLAPYFTAVKAATDKGSSVRDSATLAQFMAQGHFTRHLGRTRRAYSERHQLLLEHITQLGGQVANSGRGLHLAVRWPHEHWFYERSLLTKARAQGLKLTPIHAYAWGRSNTGRSNITRSSVDSILMGFAAYTTEELIAALNELKTLN